MMSDAMPVYREGFLYEKGRYRPYRGLDSLYDLSEKSDVVVCWGFGYSINPLIDVKQTRLVNVAHNFRIDISCFVNEHHHLGAVSQECTRAFGGLHHRVKVIENGIDVNRCLPLRGRTEMRAEWGCRDNDLVVGYIGRVAEVKNCLALARAIQGLGDRAKLVVYGERVPDEAILNRQMDLLADDRHLFFDPIEDVGSVLHAIDVFMLPSYSEGFSLSLLEAWAAGRPVVATRVGALPSLEERHGPLVTPIEPEDPPEVLAEAVRTAVNGSGEIVRRAREMVLRDYHVRRMAQQWTDFLVSVAEEPETPERDAS